jgi:anti-sigma regulatory factor (Ser/Thr protein kinase)
MTALRTQYPSTVANARKARRDVIDFAEHWFSGQSLHDIECAVGEALANAVEHGAKQDGVFAVACSVIGDKLVIEITDSGEGFQYRSGERAGDDAPCATRGYGTHIMCSFMDRVAYSERGTRLRLMKRLPRLGTARVAEQRA